MSGARLTSLSVLLVEDNCGNEGLAEVALRNGREEAEAEYHVTAVGSLALAAARLQMGDRDFDAILFDLGLSDGGGLDGLRSIRNAAPHVPVILLTGISDLHIAGEALKNGAADCLEKGDLRPRRLLRAILCAIERKKNEGELIRLARTDSLTGLLNRRAFFEQLDLALDQARRTNLPCAVILFDIDCFKEINDVFGHKTGDSALIEVARRLREQLRETDAIARIGGDEFAILATNLNSSSAAIEIAEKVARTIKSIVEIDEMRLDMSISVGISVFPEDDSSAQVLVSHADVAMYKSKGSEKGSVNFFDSRMDEIVKARHVLKRAMPEDIVAGRFYLLFQPIVDATTRRMTGAEGLARWLDLGNRVVSPRDFIPIAEESGSIVNLGNRLLEDACRHLRGWSDLNKTLVPISINISPVQCGDPSFAARLIDTIDRLEVAPNLINVEMTEASMFKRAHVIHKNLEMIKTHGIGVHVDDFGTGYSSLSFLRDLPLSAVKIDSSIVNEVGKVGASEFLIEAVVNLAKKLGFDTIAEGVETEEQVVLLRDMGVNFLQGYYFSEPVPGNQIVSWLGKSVSYLVA